MRLALYQPDIPQNTGSLIRLGACLGVAVDIIGPCGFVLSDKKLRRVGMDYLQKVELAEHASWTAFLEARPVERLILLTTHASMAYTAFSFSADDVLLLGRESAGVPEAVHAAATARIGIPLRPGLRSLNVAMAAAMVVGEALRQTGWSRESGKSGMGASGVR